MESVIDFFGNLLNPATWKRVGMVVIGGVLIVLALTRWQLSNRAAFLGGF